MNYYHFATFRTGQPASRPADGSRMELLRVHALRQDLRHCLAMDLDPLEKLRSLCLALPETTERLSHGEPAWFVREKKTFVTYDNYHHNRVVLAFWCAAPPGAQDVLVGADPDRFFVPPYVGHRGWLGVRLDAPSVDWDEIALLVEDAYRNVAPKPLLLRLDASRAR